MYRHIIFTLGKQFKNFNLIISNNLNFINVYSITLESIETVKLLFVFGI